MTKQDSFADAARSEFRLNNLHDCALISVETCDAMSPRAPLRRSKVVSLRPYTMTEPRCAARCGAPISIWSLEGGEFGRHKVANCRGRNEILSDVFAACHELSAHYAKQAFAIGIENT
jgi:hypothetical protein